MISRYLIYIIVLCFCDHFCIQLISSMASRDLFIFLSFQPVIKLRMCEHFFGDDCHMHFILWLLFNPKLFRTNNRKKRISDLNQRHKFADVIYLRRKNVKFNNKRTYFEPLALHATAALPASILNFFIAPCHHAAASDGNCELNKNIA